MNWDIRLSLSEDGDEHRIQIFDPSETYGREVVDGRDANGEKVDRNGIFNDFDTEAIREVRLFDADGALVIDNLSSATRAVLENQHGEKLTFEVFDRAGVSLGQLVDPLLGKVAQFGGDHYCTVKDYQGVAGSAERTCAGWIRTTRQGAIMNWGEDGASGGRWNMRVHSGGSVVVSVRSGWIRGATDLRDGQWHHVAVVLPTGETDIKDARIYVDGQLEAIGSSRSATVDTQHADDVMIGNDVAGREFDGNMDDMRIYSRELSAGEIASLASNTPGALDTDAALEGHWNFEQVQGATILDSSSNNRAAIISNVFPEIAGRLVGTADRNDYGMTLKYKNEITDTDILRDEQWKIHTITDAYGREAAFTYHPLQVSGSWAVDTITLPNDQEIRYTYGDSDDSDDSVHNGGKLTGVYHPDGTHSEFTYRVQSGFCVIDFDDAAASRTHRRKTVYYSTDINVVEIDSDNERFQDNGFQLFSGSTMQIRAAVNPDNELIYANLTGDNQPGAPVNVRLVYEGAGKMKNVEGHLRAVYLQDISVANGASGFSAIRGQKEATSSSLDGSEDPREYETGAISAYVDAQGARYTMEYNAEHFPTKKTYGDGTVERWSYDTEMQGDQQFNLVTRYEDRLGRVTENKYDNRGNQIERRVGIVNTAVYNQESPNVDDEAISDSRLDGSSGGANEFGLYRWVYHDDGINQNLLEKSFDANDNETQYFYTDDDSHLVERIMEADDDGTGFHIQKSFVYEDANGSARRLRSSTDAVRRTTTYFYDERDRQIMMQYNDDSTERTAYGEPDTPDANLVVATQDRNGNVTTMAYDSYGRMIERITASHKISLDDVQNTEQPNLLPLLNENNKTESTVQAVYTCEYLDGTSLRSRCTNRGEVTQYNYDYRQRVISTTVTPRAGESLVSSTNYVNNLVLSTTDPYGRKRFNYYRPSDNALVRTVQATKPNPADEPTGFEQVLNLTRARDTPETPDLNGDYLIRDSIVDAEGQTIASIDPRGVVDAMVYDSRGRNIVSIEAATTLPPYVQGAQNDGLNPANGTLDILAARTEMNYDANSNVVSVRHPRWFTSSSDDELGSSRSRTDSTYTRRNLLASTTVAAGAPAHEGRAGGRATMSYTYYPDGRKRRTRDFRGNITETLWHECCGRYQGQIDQAGHGMLSNTDFYGNVTHTAFVRNLLDAVDRRSQDTDSGDVSTDNANGLRIVASAHDPDNDRTLSETTTRYDERNRPIASTVWLDPLGRVYPNDVPIYEGGDGPKGLTTRMFYDENLIDNEGLNAGITIPRLGTADDDDPAIVTINIQTLIAEMNNDGINIDGVGSNDFYATATVNPEDEVSVSISDGAGRGVIRGQYGPDGTLITWSSVLHDRIEQVADFGPALATINIDGENNVTKSRTDGGGRTLEVVNGITFDEAGSGFTGPGFVARVSYDGNGNVVISRDPNGVGQDCVYDIRDRRTTCTDTHEDQTFMEYDLNSNVTKMKDAQGEESTYLFDARDRRVEAFDRLGGRTTTRYDHNSNVRFILDADQSREGRWWLNSGATRYTYDVRNLKTSCISPDHDPDAGANSDFAADFDEKRYEYDGLSRTTLMTDQNGDTQTHMYDMASRLEQRDYRLADNSPAGAIADSDVFEYDKASRRISAESRRYGNTCSMEYDDAGRVSSESLLVNGTTFETINAYDHANRLIKQTYPDGSAVDREYTNRNQLEQVDWTRASAAKSTVHNREYDAGMRLKSFEHGNGVTSNFVYRGAESQPRDNQLTAINTPSPGTEGVGNYSYTYDPNKNKTSETITGRLQGFGFGNLDGTPTVYDKDDRLTTWSRSDGNHDQTWNLSLVGRWEGLNERTTENGATNIQNQMLRHTRAHEITFFGDQNAADDTVNVTHDLKGNRTQDQQGRSFKWDFDNRLQEATVPVDTSDESFTHQYTYDATGRRVSKIVETAGGIQTTIFVCSGPQVVCEYQVSAQTAPDPVSPSQRYVYGSYVDEVILKDGQFTDGTSGIVYYHRNQQYSIIALSNESGEVVERYAYTAYGETTIFGHEDGEIVEIDQSAFANPYTYTARRADDEIGLLYFRARYYDPNTGEFISRDPLGFVDGMSQYRAYFVPGGVDPSGLAWQSLILSDVAKSPQWTIASAKAKLNLWQAFVTLDGNGFADNLMRSFLTKAGGYNANAKDTAQVKKDMKDELYDVVDDYMSKQNPAVNAPGNCPAVVPIKSLTSTGFKPKGGTYPRASVLAHENLNAYIYFGGVAYDISGTATLKAKHGWIDCECDYTVNVDVTWQDNFDFKPTGLLNGRLANQFYNAGHFLQTKKGFPPFQFQVSYNDTFTWTAE